MSEGEATSDKPQLIASRAHFAVFLWIQIAMAIRGGSGLRRFIAVGDPETLHVRLVWFYVLIIVWEWVLLSYVWWGVRKRGLTLRALVGGRWASPWDVAKDVGIGLTFWFLWMFATIAFAKITGLTQQAPDEVRAMTPATGLGLILWAAISISAGFCEEVIYRGYLQRQFFAMTGSVPVAIIGQGLLFGIVHSYQGMFGVAVISVMGILFGLLAAWRRSLRPGMIAHAWYDGVIGILMFLANTFRGY